VKRIWTAVAIAALATLIGWWLWPSGNGAGTLRFETVELERGDITRVVSSVGSVRALNTVEVGSQLSGQIETLLVDYNSPVQVGDLLARLDPQTFERRAQEAEANLAVARATVEIQAASIQRAEANLKLAEREFERQKSLIGRGSVSESALDAAEAAWQSAQADVAIARAQYQNARATVEQREAALEAARIDLERTEIRSPIDGVVIDRAVDVGQTVAASLQAPILFTIAQDLAEIRIEASVDEADIGSVRPGAPATFTVDAFPGREFSGEVAQVRLAPNEEGNVVTYTVVINAGNPERRLLPGMTASIDIVTGKRENVLRVANAAVRFRPPEDLVPDDDPGQARQNGPGSGAPGGNPGARFDAALAELGIDDATRQQIGEDMRESFSGIGGLFASGMDRDQIRSRMQEMSEEVLRRHLTAEQFEAWRALAREQAETRPATLYLAEDDRLVARPVRLGISDDRFTEIVTGDVGASMSVVTRILRAESG